MARVMQESLLPKVLPSEDNVVFHGNLHQTQKVGGDFYDVFRLPDGRYCIFVGDVSGHGVAAAFPIMLVKNALHNTAFVDHPGMALGEMNQMLSKLLEEARFMTAFLGIYNPLTRKLHYANAGHPKPIHAKGSPVVLESLPSQGVPLGFFSTETYEEFETELASGETLYLYTDGITDVLNLEKGGFGERRLKSFLQETHGIDFELQEKKLFERLLEYSGQEKIEDDALWIVIQAK